MGDFDFSDIDFQKIDKDLANEELEKTMDDLKKIGPGAVMIFELGRAVGRVDILNRFAEVFKSETTNLEMFLKGNNG